MADSVSNQKRWAVVIPAMTLPFISAFLYFILLSGNPIATGVYGFTKIFTLVWPVVVVWWIFRQKLPPFRLKEAHHWKGIPLGILMGALIMLFAWGALHTPVGDVVKASSGAIKEKTLQMNILPYYWWFATFISVFHSLLEEYYWRWFVFGQLHQLVKPVTAHLLAGLAFAAHHVVILSQFFGWGWGFGLGAFVGIGGIIWSIMLIRQKSLIGIWVSHAIVDWGMMAIGYMLIQQT